MASIDERLDDVLRHIRMEEHQPPYVMTAPTSRCDEGQFVV